jgi:hypothetical protein
MITSHLKPKVQSTVEKLCTKVVPQKTDSVQHNIDIGQ